MRAYIIQIFLHPKGARGEIRHAVREALSVLFVRSGKMVSFSQCLGVFQFIFFLTSPLTSYGDQIVSMHRRKSSAGFSIDVCGIMLHARYTPGNTTPAGRWAPE
jgi:hypothetical protein